MIEKPVYCVTVKNAKETCRFERTFLFEPTPADIILILQDRLGQIERSITEGDEEDAEYLSHDLEAVQSLCEVVNALSKPLKWVNGMRTANPVHVAGTLVGSIWVQCYLALDRP